MGVYTFMGSFADYLARGDAWFFLPAAILLGALHGLEPGHSKTMMAAFIVSVRGTVAQAVLLGLSAAFSHTLIIWVLAAIGLHYSQRLDVEGLEPWFQLATGVIVVGMALWMFRRLRREQPVAHTHEHAHEHGPHGGMMLDVERGKLEISVFETGVPPRFRLYFFDPSTQLTRPPLDEQITLATQRPKGVREIFRFKPSGEYLEAVTELPEPHEFGATVTITQGGKEYIYETQFVEDHRHQHGDGTSTAPSAEYQDAHEREHAVELQKRFAGQSVTTRQIVLFGLTGGLMPCPAAFAILLLCLQVKRFTLGFALVLAFSLGLAITLVTVGAVAAVSVRMASRRFAGFGALARRLPFASVGLMTLIGLAVAAMGLTRLIR